MTRPARSYSARTRASRNSCQYRQKVTGPGSVSRICAISRRWSPVIRCPSQPWNGYQIVPARAGTDGEPDTDTEGEAGAEAGAGAGAEAEAGGEGGVMRSRYRKGAPTTVACRRPIDQARRRVRSDQTKIGR